jgi:nucleoid-associated protein YgaU
MAETAQPAKAFLQVEGGEPFHFLFNPAELVIDKNVTWEAAKAKGKNAPRLRFQEGQSGTFSFTAVFDTTADGSDVTEHTSRLLKLMHTDEDLQGSDRQRNQARPPWVRFHWGGLHSFKAVVEQARISFTYFSPTGTALRAKVDLGLRQFEDDGDLPLQNPTSGTPRPQRTHHVRAGETLDRIAALYYGDPARWRVLADANRVDDPLRLAVGTDLAVPEPEVRRRGR